jgi:tetrahydromethanopterin S-methyltransferase subunit B
MTAEQRREYVFLDLDKLLERFDSLDLAAKRSLMRYVVDRVIVHDEHVETVLWL